MKREVAYNLYHGLEKFKEEAKRKGFHFEYSNTGSYEIRKKVTPTKNKPYNFMIVGGIFNGQFLIVYSSLLPFQKGDVKYKQAISQLEEIADNFVVIFKRKKVGVNEQAISILKFCYISRSKSEILKHLNLSDIHLLKREF